MPSWESTPSSQDREVALAALECISNRTPSCRVISDHPRSDHSTSSGLLLMVAGGHAVVLAGHAAIAASTATLEAKAVLVASVPSHFALVING